MSVPAAPVIAFLIGLLVIFPFPNRVHAAVFAGAAADSYAFGTITGRVVDAETGDVLPSVTISVGRIRLSASTNFMGEFTILAVPVGDYTLRATSIGFAPVRVTDVWVSAGLETVVNIRMNPTAPEPVEEVVVSASRYDVGKRKTGTIHVISEDEISRLPAENVLDILGILPGIVDNAFVRGGRASEVDYQIDGVSFRDFLFGGLPQGSLISNLALKEIQVISGGMSANHGSALSGMVNLITRDGGPDWTGEIRVKNSFPQLNGRNGSAKLNPRGERIIEFNAGGPLPVGNKLLSLFLNGRMDTQQNRTPGLDIRDPLGNNITDYAHNSQAQVSLFGKASARLSPDIKVVAGGYFGGHNHEEDSWFWRYNDSFNDRPSVSQKTELGYLKFTHTPFNNFLYEVFLEYMDHRSSRGIKDELKAYKWWTGYSIIPEVNYDVPVVYGAHNPYGVQDVFINQGVLDSYWSTRARYYGGKVHAVWQSSDFLLLKFGAEAKRYLVRNSYRGNGFEEPTYRQNNYERDPLEYAGYAAGTLRFSRLRVDAGLQFNYLDLNVLLSPKSMTGGEDNFSYVVDPKIRVSPRIGMSLELNEELTGHAHFGTYFQAPVFHSLYAGQPEGDYRGGGTIEGNPHLTPQRAQSFEAGFSLLLSDLVTFDITGYTKQLDNLEAVSVIPYSRSAFGEYTNGGSSYVEGLELSLTRRRSDKLAMTLSYTYSTARGTLSFLEPPSMKIFSNEAASSQQTVLFSGSSGQTAFFEYYLPFDRRHNFRAVADLRLPEKGGPVLLKYYPFENMDISLTASVGTGTPYTRQGFDGSFLGEFNMLRHPWYADTNIRLQKFFPNNYVRFCLFMDVRNLFNRTEPRYYYPVTGNPDYPGVIEREYSQNAGKSDDLSSFLYSPVADLNNNGTIEPDENEAAYRKFLSDFIRLKSLYQKPREVWVGITFQF